MHIDRTNYEIWLVDWLDGNLDETRAKELQLFLESNPIPTKAALALKGICGDTLRLPLQTASAATKARLAELLSAGVGVA